ncbi:response regulator transcription factor [Clostridium tyrobutyricum]|jgi:DNA-binding response OmpR family regulator|uniref:response regulator transcription factor n=1 Tax=Clostridium tyrobutyricum TaxID=1519 RepID=UPI001C3804DF|nr:response regulator transcription factor [Clostridium tyrobutyricum]MBV4427465.1 response regulator transcription factor [Clostridium tyrobutyricum]MBV4443767.1 response regulator transcription factor [Clostridium tyrobutyricum]MCH4199645.1 response regulator transcription factor [Clostridium tyrobutyricum]
MANILAIDDEEDILDIIKESLSREGHRVTIVSDFSTFPIEKCLDYDLILLDVMMHGMDGFTLCRSIRNLVDCPIVFLTAKIMEEDIIAGLQVGGDDYITKPFGIGELRSRVAAHLRRECREKHNGFILSGVKFKLSAKEVYIGDKLIPLTKSEYEISEFLAVNHGQVFSREKIYESVFGFEGSSDSSCIVEHIKNIRSKFDKVNCHPIETVWGIGYKWA